MITLLYAAILGLLSVLLANQVLYVRLRGGKEEKWRSNATERVQANFVENVPLALIILFIFEYSSSSNNLIHIFGILLVLFRIKTIKNSIWIATFLAVLGLYILLDPAGKGLNLGDMLTFGCALSFAAHVIYQDRYLSRDVNIGILLLIQLFFITLFSGISVISYEGFEIVLSQRLMVAIIVTGILATFLALLIMVWAQTILGPNQTAILLSLEPVFAALFSTFFAGDILGWNGWIGGFIIVGAILSLEFFSSKK